MDKFDYKKDLKELYGPPRDKFIVVEVPKMNFLMIDGHGNPNNNPAYQEVVEALYSMAYTIKFSLKPQGIEYVVPPPEGLWWSERMESFLEGIKEEWDWTMMIMQPSAVTSSIVEAARAEAVRKKNPPALPRLRFEAYQEGLSVQTMYHGPYADEGPTIAAMHDFIKTGGYRPNGKHHEIYLGDPRKTAPEKLRTVIRQPIGKN